MNKLLTRGVLGIAALAAPVGASLALPVAAAHAAPATSNPAWTVATNGQILSGTYKNIDVPAGVTAHIEWSHVTGNVTVEGVLGSTATIFDHNVDVSGPGSQLWLYNYASHIQGNLSVTNSSGAWNGSGGTSFGDNTSYVGPDAATANGTSQVDGNFKFQNNTGWLYVGGPLQVGGNFTASDNGPYANPGHFDHSGLTVSGNSSIS
jgi:hypothetical protein